MQNEIRDKVWLVLIDKTIGTKYDVSKAVKKPSFGQPFSKNYNLISMYLNMYAFIKLHQSCTEICGRFGNLKSKSLTFYNC